MARYVFSHGKVEVEEGIFLPASRRDRRQKRTGVLILIPLLPPTGKQSESMLDEENLPDERQ